jgi:hypothetical protein
LIQKTFWTQVLLYPVLATILEMGKNGQKKRVLIIIPFFS